MAETLLAILLVTSSARGSSLVCRWPPSPSSSPRLSRARPGHPSYPSQLDNPWRAAHYADASESTTEIPHRRLDDEPEYQWKRPDALRDRSISFSHSVSRPPSGRNSPSKDGSYNLEDPTVKDEYDDLFGYSSEFLAGLLCPQRPLCHQKFELLVDELAFVGHPVCAESDGEWRFKPEKVKPSARGRESRNRQSSQSNDAPSATPDAPILGQKGNTPRCSWLQTFHFVIVLDIPDPSSSASGNVSKYFDIIYEQIAFTIAAVLFQEQVLSNFVESECDILGSLKDSYMAKGEPFSSYMSRALQVSSIAPAMKSIYEAIKSSSIAYVTIHNLPLELQLPPYLDLLLHTEEENEIDFVSYPDDDDSQAWGQEMSFGWKLPALAPWKSLLLLDGHNGLDPYMNLRGPHVSPGDRTLAEGLIKFLETASVTLSLADMASLLDWDLESQVFPTVRWLVHHRRAKVVDIVHAGLKTVFTLPPKFDLPLSKLTADFEDQFSHPSIPSLPQILSTISTSISKQSDNHFFATAVRSKDLIPLYHDIVLWMLKRDMLITLHLRVRVVATQELKVRVRLARGRAQTRKTASRKERGRSGARQELGIEDGSGILPGSPSGIAWLSLSPKSARRYSRRLPSNDSGSSKISELIIKEADEEDKQDDEEHEIDEGISEPEDEEDVGWDTAEDHLWPSMINDPGRATPLQRHWLSAMSEGKDIDIAKRFEMINQYFDGRKTDDEILFRAEISRKQLREVLHHYEEYLQTFLHPS